MTALVINLGTSDLCIQVDGYYFPVGFNRREPNIDVSDLSPDEQVAWDYESKEEFVADISKELGIDDGGKPASFRQLTEVILDAYRSNIAKWHDRIRPGRFHGVFEAAKRYGVTQIYCIVTDQNPSHPSDTYYLYDLLIEWLRNCNSVITDLVTFNRVVIGQDCSAIDEDTLLGKYYQVLGEIARYHELLLVSSKGGTPQMQTALKIQSMALADKVLFIDPILSVKKILHGQSSDCKTTSYWNYTKINQYELIRNLLARFDFDGALGVIRKYNHNLITLNAIDQFLSYEMRIGSLIESYLKIASCYLNLDIDGARQEFSCNELRNENVQSFRLDINENYNTLLNLFTQAKLYKNLGRHVEFLIRLSTFCDEAYNFLFKTTDKYFMQEYQRADRFRKRYALKSRGLSIVRELERLDYWLERRNDIIHQGRGISEVSILELNRNKPRLACRYDEIVPLMAAIYRRVHKLVQNKGYHHPVNYINPSDKYLNVNEPYYLYSTIRDFILEEIRVSS